MKFHIDMRMDGANEVSVEIKRSENESGRDAVVRVRPKHSRIVYTGLLSDVAAIVQSRHAKALVAAQGIAVPKARRGR